LGAVLPSFLIILAIALFFREIRQEPLVEAAFRGMRPAVVALILYPVITLARGIHPWAIPVVILSALAIWWLGLSPILLIILGAIGGITLHFINLKRGTKQ
jgi:chromate transporter